MIMYNKYRLILKEDNAILGVRYSFIFMNQGSNSYDIFKSCDLGDSVLAKEFEKTLNKLGWEKKNNNYVLDLALHLEGEVYKTKNESMFNAIEIDSLDGCVDFLKGIQKGHKEWEENAKRLSDLLDESLDTLRRCLRNEGVSIPEGLSIDYSNSIIEARFLGGYGAWDDGSEDICDSCSLDRKVGKSIEKAVSEFTRKTGLRMSFQTGEKAWTYFVL